MEKSSSSSPPAPPSDIPHHFFKVYMPASCLHSLTIPMTFMMKLNGVTFEKVVLKDPLKRLWQVEVTKVEGVFYFQKGWEEFVKGNCLKMGQFLVFQYVEHSAFYVDIFDNTGCEKKFESKDDSRKKLDKTSRSSVNEEEVESESESESESDDQTSSFSDYLPSEGEDCEEKIYKSKPSAVSNGESKLPHFVVSLKETNVHALHIPNTIVNRDDIDIKQKMVLRDPSQRSWPVNICFYTDRTVIGKGWYDFWKRNKLQPGHQCMFEFNKCKVKGRDENSNVINVKVVRATGKRPSAPHKT